MATQSEAAMEKCLLEQLVEQGHEQVKIKDENGLKTNLKYQLEKFNKIKLENDEFDRIFTYLESGTIFDKAKKLRDRYALRRDDETVYIQFFYIQ